MKRQEIIDKLQGINISLQQKENISDIFEDCINSNNDGG